MNGTNPIQYHEFEPIKAPSSKTSVLASCSVEDRPVTVSIDLEGTVRNPMQSSSHMLLIEDEVRRRHGTMASRVACSSVTPVKTTDHRWLSHGMSRSCGPNFNVNDVSTYNKYRCTYQGTGLVDGQMVRQPNREWTGMLASCDQYASSEGGKISNDLMRDIREHVYYKAGGEEAKLNMEDFSCSVMSLPYTSGH